MKKNNFLIYIIIIIVVILAIFFVFNFFNKNENNSTNNLAQNSSTFEEKNFEENSIVYNNLSVNTESNTAIFSVPKEEEISAFSTELKDKSEGRLTNIGITCSTLNETIIQTGETFSFNQTVGKPTAEKGYKEASVIIDHKTEKGIGGGNCQVSSTLYNAVLAIPSLIVTERHEHGKDVTYVPDGKDAAVSYGSLDLKFRNDTGYNIKILASTDNKTVTIKLLKLN